jgi:hypothetical protein
VPVRALLLVIALLIVLGATLSPFGRHVPLDPDEPIAQDHSLSAGRARTIFDFEPALGAFGEPKRPDPDSPSEIQERFEIEQDWIRRRRDTIAAFLYALDGAFCEESYRQGLISALKGYYDARLRQKHGFSVRGPHAKAFIEAAWSTSLDRRIDSLARRLVISGTIKPRDMPAESVPEFANVVSGVTVTGDGCASFRAEGR